MKEGAALMHVYVYIGTHNQPFLQKHLMDVYENLIEMKYS